jgi:S-adenosylmethionine hydrolase
MIETLRADNRNTLEELYPKPCGLIALLTDFGLEDPYVAAIKAVGYSICSNIKIVDITHNVDSFDIESAALILYMVYRYFPKGAIFVVVVDPGVGSSRKPIAIATRNYIFIGPDNGVLTPAAKDDGIIDIRLLENDNYFHKPVSYSFHGRDIFMPIASHLVCGARFDSLGRPLDPTSITYIDTGIGYLEIEDKCVQLKIIHIDKFGNVMLSIPFVNLSQILGLDIGVNVKVYSHSNVFTAKVEKVFSVVPKGTLVLYENSFGLAELAVNQGSAKEYLNVTRKSKIKICKS